MMKINTYTFFNLNNLVPALVISGLLLLSACGGGSSEVEKVQIANNAPSVNAGADQSVSANDDVLIAASASDSDGTIESYLWTQLSGVNVSLTGADAANASFVAPTLSDQESVQLAFRITVTDDKGSSATDTVNINIDQSASNTAPNVNAGQDQSAQEGDNVSLSATASDDDGTIESYSWTQLSGTSVNIASANSAAASFAAPSVPNDQSQLTLSFQILVTDNNGANSTDSISVTVSAQPDNAAPTVSAGDDMAVNEQTSVTLIATASDSDGSIISYNWVQTVGNSLTLNNATSAQADFTSPTLADTNNPETYVFDVTVTDDTGLTATDSVSVLVQAADTQDCTQTISPGMQFDTAFAQLSAGDTLCLNDGKYMQAMNIPSNINVRAVNDGMAELDGGGTLGWDWQGGILTMKGNNSSVRGLRVHHARQYSDACMIGGNSNTMQFMSCSHGGTYKHAIPLKVVGSGHLVEDSWFFGEGRYVFQCYSGDNITIRRNVIRWDKTISGEPNEPNASMSNYSCNDMIWENNISLDYGVPATYMVHCGDICMSTIANDPNLRVQYLGNMVVNHDSNTGNYSAFRADQKGTAPSSDITINDFYVRDNGAGIVVNPLYQNVTVGNCTMINVIEEGGAPGTPANCQGNADVSVRYIDGIKTTETLFPFAHEALIKRDMCASGERQSDWCISGKSLSDYVLNQ